MAAELALAAAIFNIAASNFYDGYSYNVLINNPKNYYNIRQ